MGVGEQDQQSPLGAVSKTKGSCPRTEVEENWNAETERRPKSDFDTSRISAVTRRKGTWRRD